MPEGVGSGGGEEYTGRHRRRSEDELGLPPEGGEPGPGGPETPPGAEAEEARGLELPESREGVVAVETPPWAEATDVGALTDPDLTPEVRQQYRDVHDWARDTMNRQSADGRFDLGLAQLNAGVPGRTEAEIARWGSEPDHTGAQVRLADEITERFPDPAQAEVLYDHGTEVVEAGARQMLSLKAADVGLPDDDPVFQDARAQARAHLRGKPKDRAATRLRVLQTLYGERYEAHLAANDAAERAARKERQQEVKRGGREAAANAKELEPYEARIKVVKADMSVRAKQRMPAEEGMLELARIGKDLRERGVVTGGIDGQLTAEGRNQAEQTLVDELNAAFNAAFEQHSEAGNIEAAQAPYHHEGQERVDVELLQVELMEIVRNTTMDPQKKLQELYALRDRAKDWLKVRMLEEGAGGPEEERHKRYVLEPANPDAARSEALSVFMHNLQQALWEVGGATERLRAAKPGDPERTGTDGYVEMVHRNSVEGLVTKLNEILGQEDKIGRTKAFQDFEQYVEQVRNLPDKEAARPEGSMTPAAQHRLDTALEAARTEVEAFETRFTANSTHIGQFIDNIEASKSAEDQQRSLEGALELASGEDVGVLVQAEGGTGKGLLDRYQALDDPRSQAVLEKAQAAFERIEGVRKAEEEQAAKVAAEKAEKEKKKADEKKAKEKDGEGEGKKEKDKKDKKKKGEGSASTDEDKLKMGMDAARKAIAELQAVEAMPVEKREEALRAILTKLEGVGGVVHTGNDNDGVFGFMPAGGQESLDAWNEARIIARQSGLLGGGATTDSDGEAGKTPEPEADGDGHAELWEQAVAAAGKGRKEFNVPEGELNDARIVGRLIGSAPNQDVLDAVMAELNHRGSFEIQGEPGEEYLAPRPGNRDDERYFEFYYRRVNELEQRARDASEQGDDDGEQQLSYSLARTLERVREKYPDFRIPKTGKLNRKIVGTLIGFSQTKAGLDEVLEEVRRREDQVPQEFMRFYEEKLDKLNARNKERAERRNQPERRPRDGRANPGDADVGGGADHEGGEPKPAQSEEESELGQEG